jgi:hypothetical protein
VFCPMGTSTPFVGAHSQAHVGTRSRASGAACLDASFLLLLPEYLVAAELMQQCGDIALGLRLVEYSGDYFL